MKTQEHDEQFEFEHSLYIPYKVLMIMFHVLKWIRVCSTELAINQQRNTKTVAVAVTSSVVNLLMTPLVQYINKKHILILSVNKFSIIRMSSHFSSAII